MDRNMEKAESALKLLPGFQYLYKGEANAAVLEYLMKKGWALEASGDRSIDMALQAGMDKSDIYCTAFSDTPPIVKASVGRCRFVASSYEELELVNEAAAGYLPPGRLEVIGIAVVLKDYDDGRLAGFKTEELARLSAEARKLRFISIRGCFAMGNTGGLSGESLGKYLQSCYETAKLVTTAIPCGMSYVNAGDCMEPVLRTVDEGQEACEKLKTAAKIVVSQSQTFSYTKLMMQ